MITESTPKAVRRDSAQTPSSKHASSTRNAQCTHVTMTRLYSDDFRCALCLQHGNMGWLYRCTQDKELEMDAEILGGNLPNFDSFSRTFPLSTTPRKGTPMARDTNLDFLREVCTQPTGIYTREQIDMIISQRQKASVVSIIEDLGFSPKSEGIYLELPEDSESPFPKFSDLPPTSQRKRARSYLPYVDCQFKCCHACRPTSIERAFLSLDAIAKGDIPPTAISGFGFHLLGERPVAPADTVRNIGLRIPLSSKSETQFDRTNTTQFHTEHTTAVKNAAPSTPTKSSPFNDGEDADSTFGQPATNAYDSTAMTRRVNKEPKPPSPPPKIPLPENPYGPLVVRIFHSIALSSRRRSPASSTPKSESGSRYNPFTPKNTPATPSRSAGLGIVPDDTPTDRTGRARDGIAIPRSRFSIDLEDGDVGLATVRRSRIPRSTYMHVAADLERSFSTKSNVSDVLKFGEADTSEKGLSEMEKKEEAEGFGGEPLELKNGIALTEEAVELHVPDVITHV